LGIRAYAIIFGIILLPVIQSAYAESEIPEWVKNNAGWWSEGLIGDSDFVSGIQFLIKEEIMIIPETKTVSQTSKGIPEWVKNNAGWWSEGLIGDSDFVSGIQFLIQQGIMVIDVDSTDQQSDVIIAPPQVPTPETESPTTATVKILSGSNFVECVKNDSCFSPTEATINSGITVIWKNEDDVTHGIISGTIVKGPDGIFEDLDILPGETFSHTFELAGIYQYYDFEYSWMNGVIIVRASSDSSVIIPFDVETNKYWYQNGELVNVWGKALPDENSALPISFSVVGPSGKVFATAQFMPSEDGSFSYDELRVGGSKWKVGDYEIILEYGSQKGSTTIGYLG